VRSALSIGKSVLNAAPKQVLFLHGYQRLGKRKPGWAEPLWRLEIAIQSSNSALPRKDSGLMNVWMIVVTLVLAGIGPFLRS
jgi:hypothetical protein